MKKSLIASLLALICQGIPVLSYSAPVESVATGTAPAPSQPARSILGRAAIPWLNGPYQPEPARWQDDIPEQWAPVVAAMQTGKYAEALQLLPPGNDLPPEVVLLKAEILLAQEQAAAAQVVLERALVTYYAAATDPLLQQRFMAMGRTVEPVHRLAPRLAALMIRAYLRMDNTAFVRRAFDHTRFQDREYLLAHGDFARLTSQVEEARQAYQQVLQLDPDNTEARAALQALPTPQAPVKRKSSKNKGNPAPARAD